MAGGQASGTLVLALVRAEPIADRHRIGSREPAARPPCGNDLFDPLRHVGAIGLPAGKPRDPFRSDEGVVQRAQQELTSPDNRGTRQIRQARLNGIDEGLRRLIEDLRDDATDRRVPRPTSQRQPREPRAASRQVAAGRKGRQYIGPHDPSNRFCRSRIRMPRQKLDSPPVHRREVALIDRKQKAVLAFEVIGDAARIGAGLLAMSRIETALKPLVENSAPPR